jgi:hypothetical protein
MKKIHFLATIFLINIIAAAADALVSRRQTPVLTRGSPSSIVI